MKNLDYKGGKSTRLWLALCVFAVASDFLVFHVITETAWLYVTNGSVITYIASEGVSKFSEAYRDKQTGEDT